MIARRRVLTALATLLLPMSLATETQAHDPITWHSIDCGGVSFSTAGGYRLGGTIGQPDAGALAGGEYTLRGGFWLGGQASQSGVPDRSHPNAVFRLLPTAPNPVRSQSRVVFELPTPSRVTLSIFDVSGRAVQRRELGLLPPGRQEQDWSTVDDRGRPLATGVYFLRVDTGRDRGSQKIVVVR